MIPSVNYSLIADFYDIFYRMRSDIRYYYEEAKKANGKVLEIGCGTGRVLIPLFEKGIDIEGLDISKKMLAVLKEKIKSKHPKPAIYLKDMRNFSLKKKYALIIIPLRTFMHLSSDKERLVTLTNCYNHLSQNGKLIIHIYNSLFFKQSKEFKPINSKFFYLNGEKITAIWYERYIPYKEKVEYLVDFIKKNKRIKKFVMPLYFIDNRKIKELLKKAKFRKVTIYSDFGKTIFSESKKPLEMIVVATK